MAAVYDDFTAHHTPDLWIGMLLELGEAHGLQGDTVLDVACGTGKSFLPLIERGWKVTACDIAPSMLEIARAKVGDQVRLEVADMRALPVFGSFDLVCCFGDAVNYMLSTPELEQALTGLAANLAPDGILIFDSNTLAAYRGFFAEQVEVEVNGRRLIWNGRTGGVAEPGQISEAIFEVEPLAPDVTSSIPAEIHTQRHHPEAEVRAAIGAAGLELLGLYGHHYDGVPSRPMSEDDHIKAIYISRLRRQT